MRNLRIVGVTVSLIGALLLTAAPAGADRTPASPGPSPTPTQFSEEPLGWDENGPYIVWGNMGCKVHLFVPEEWSWLWGTGPCWF